MVDSVTPFQAIDIAISDRDTLSQIAFATRAYLSTHVSVHLAHMLLIRLNGCECKCSV